MNLLLFTQVYPDEIGCITLRSSSVCHYWTKEWVKQGHSVVVIYCYPNYHSVFHKIAKLYPQYIAQYTNGTLTIKQTKQVSYSIDGVDIFKIPMYKPLPKIRYTNRRIEAVVQSALDYLHTKGYKPDLIFSHFDNPILEIAGKCKDYLRIPFSFVLHGYAKDIKRLYPINYKELIDKVDVWGYRSLAIKSEFDKCYGSKNKHFICYSGIPENYLFGVNNDLSKIRGKVCFVGALIRRKFPEKIIIALLPLLNDNSFSITYIGEGFLSKKIKRTAKKNGVCRLVRLLGHIDRESVQKELSTSDYFIMISRHETFGMVYLEAMANGCITIVSENEGFDGIIQHGINGFLCKSGDDKELYKLICQIECMDENRKIEIRRNAIETSRKMTEPIIAKKYLDTVISLSKNKCELQ